MGLNRLSVFVLLMIVTMLSLVSCDQFKRPQLSSADANTVAAVADAPANRVAGTTNVAPAVVALPNFTALVKKEGPAVINISAIKKVRNSFAVPEFPGISPNDPFYDFFRRFSFGNQLPREFISQSLGSGFIISADGYILTNAHVVEGADEVIVRLTDQREFKAKVVGSDKRSDIALLKITAKDLPVATIGDSSKLEAGEWVAAIGSPFGFINSVSQGIVSAKGRSLPGERGENIVPFIQTDVSINPGNSGGPLFNMAGEVVGVNSQIFSRSGGYMGLSFAIPIDLAMKVKNDLLKHGSVKRGRLGVNIQSVSPDHAQSFKLEKAYGALINAVEKNGPADRAGLEIGDIILKFNGQELASSEDLVREVANQSPGASVKLLVWRNGAAKEITVKLGEADSESTTLKQQPDDRAAELDHLGLTVRELNGNEQRMLRTNGSLIVEGVADIAARSGVQVEDIIIAVNSQRVSSIKQLRTELNKAGKNAAVLVEREGNLVFIPIKFKG